MPGTPLDDDLIEGLSQAEREQLAADLAETLATLRDLDAIAEATRDITTLALIEAITRSSEALPRRHQHDQPADQCRRPPHRPDRLGRSAA